MFGKVGFFSVELQHCGTPQCCNSTLLSTETDWEHLWQNSLTQFSGPDGPVVWQKWPVTLLREGQILNSR